MLPAGGAGPTVQSKESGRCQGKRVEGWRPAARSVAVRLVPDPAAEARVHADVLELEPEGPAWQRPVVEVATLEELWPQRAAVGGRGRRLRADQQLAPAEVALEPRRLAGGSGPSSSATSAGASC